MDAFECLHGRRSIRDFLSVPVSDESLFEILNAAHSAPCAGNIDNWQFIIVTDEKTRLELASACNSQFWVGEAPVLVVVCSDTNRVRRIFGSRAEFYAVQNTSSAIENMLLAAFALGLGSCWIGSFHEQTIKDLLKIPDNIDIHAVIAIGNTAIAPPKPKKPSLEFKTFFEEYGKSSK